MLIEQAKGFVAFQHNMSVEDAFNTIRQHARRNQTRLADVAKAIVDRELTL